LLSSVNRSLFFGFASLDGNILTAPKINLKSLALDELKALLAELGCKPFRAGQLFAWIYSRGAQSFDEMTDIAKTERTLLASRFDLASLSLLRQELSADGTRKFLFKLEDGHTVESVLIPEEDRQTLCISSQVGCAQACRFCITGGGGFQRNLKAYEIADQVVIVEKVLAGGRKYSPETRSLTNIVLMGMGEPLANFDEVVKALAIITGEPGLGFSTRRVTLSTAGLVPEIEKLGRSGVKVNLAVSLNATTDEVRDRIMPVNKRYPIKELLAACRHFPLEPRRRITFEYVMLHGVNDSTEDALRLTKLLRGIKAKINLIPYNPSPGSEFKRPPDAAVKRFQQILQEHDYTALIRESRGRDISAACGQLRERETKAEK
jgi:23S rRNA (adenine2503-C2)-methyltransferase